jgi:hypothetical protein
MAQDRITQAQCHKCHSAMVYVTALPHATVPQMRRTTFVCYTCYQTRTYMLSSLMADAYAAACGSDTKVISPNSSNH